MTRDTSTMPDLCQQNPRLSYAEKAKYLTQAGKDIGVKVSAELPKELKAQARRTHKRPQRPGHLATHKRIDQNPHAHQATSSAFRIMGLGSQEAHTLG